MDYLRWQHLSPTDSFVWFSSVLHIFYKFSIVVAFLTVTKMKALLQPCIQAPQCHKTLLRNHGRTHFTADRVHLEETQIDHQ